RSRSWRRQALSRCRIPTGINAVSRSGTRRRSDWLERLFERRRESRAGALTCAPALGTLAASRRAAPRDRLRGPVRTVFSPWNLDDPVTRRQSLQYYAYRDDRPDHHVRRRVHVAVLAGAGPRSADHLFVGRDSRRFAGTGAAAS